MSHGVVAAVKDTLAVNDCQIILEIHVSIITTKKQVAIHVDGDLSIFLRLCWAR